VGSVALALALAALATDPAPPARRIVVAPEGVVATVTAALRLARPGDTIVVTAGIYREPRIEVRVPVTLLGAGAAILDGGGDHEVLSVRADGVTIRGLTIRNVGPSFVEDRAGIRLDGVRGCVVADNQIFDTFFGIYAGRSSGCTISGNRIVGHARRQTEAGNAIHLFSSTGFTVAGNHISGHRDGIYLEFSPHTVITGNESRANLRYGLHFMFSDSCEYRGNVFERNVSGVNCPSGPDSAVIWNPPSAAWAPPSRAMIWAEACARISSPGRQWTSVAATLHMVPDGMYTAASLPSKSATRSHSIFTEGSSPTCSSPTSARAIASRIPCVGRVWVSDSKLMRTAGALGSGRAGV